MTRYNFHTLDCRQILSDSRATVIHVKRHLFTVICRMYNACLQMTWAKQFWVTIFDLVTFRSSHGKKTARFKVMKCVSLIFNWAFSCLIFFDICSISAVFQHFKAQPASATHWYSVFHDIIIFKESDELMMLLVTYFFNCTLLPFRTAGNPHTMIKAVLRFLPCEIFNFWPSVWSIFAVQSAITQQW